MLTAPGHAGAAHALSGPEPLTPAGQIATLAEVLGRPLRYEPLSDDEARAQMAADTPAPYIDAFFRFYSDGEFDDAPVLDTVREITGRAPGRLRGVGAPPRRRVRIARRPSAVARRDVEGAQPRGIREQVDLDHSCRRRR